MAAIASTGFVGQLIRQVPGPLLRALDAWSHRIARRRYEERMRRWQELKLASARQAKLQLPR
jgi:hypothetical protein